MNVDFYSTKRFPDWLKKDYLEAFEKTLNEDNLIEGSSCRIFEKQFSTYLGTNDVLGVGNGFDALRISLLALGIGRGDRVAVPAHTFIATWFAIQSVGAISVGVDVTEDGQINLDLLEVQKDLKCVIPVHMHGTHCDMSRLTNWAKRNSVYVIEDCAQAAGLLIQGKKAGTWGDMGAFSFYPTKNLYALGDGGAITTNNQQLYEVARSISRYGSNKSNKYVHERFGLNSRLDSIQAAFLNINLKHLDEWNAKRIEVGKIYDAEIPYFERNSSSKHAHIFHHYVVYSDDRDRLQAHLKQNDIATEVHYPNLAGIEVRMEDSEAFPVGLKLSATGLSLPISQWQSKSETERVIQVMTKFQQVLESVDD